MRLEEWQQNWTADLVLLHSWISATTSALNGLSTIEAVSPAAAAAASTTLLHPQSPVVCD